MALTAAQGQFGPASAYWFYLAKTGIGLWLLVETWPLVKEMRPVFSWEAVVVGVGVLVMWIGIDPCYPKFVVSKHALENANPNLVFGNHSPMAWFFMLVHLFGMTVVVPPLEEVFYRSFLYRYIVKADFEAVPLNRFYPVSFVATALIFGAEHSQWLAGMLCGLAYQWLALRKNRIGDVMVAHALTNLLLGGWVIWRGAWNFW